MKDIAIICAHNPGQRNLGMYSVDLAARDFFSRFDVSYDLVKFVGDVKVGPLRYRKVHDYSELNNYRAVLFWGDFQQNPLWGQSNFAARLQKEHRGLSREKAQAKWWNNFLLENMQTPAKQQVYSIGNCFLGSSEFFTSTGELDHYRACLSRFDGICPRDVESYQILKEELQLENIIKGGVDCATLRSPIGHGSVGHGNYFSYSLRRTIKDPAVIRKVVNSVETQTGLRGVPIRWLRSKYAKYNPIGVDQCFKKCVHKICGGKFFLTDIYHATINAVCEGVPVVCIGDKSTIFKDTCDDTKKGILLKMLQSEDYYISVDPKDVDFEEIGRTAFKLSSKGNGLQQKAILQLQGELEVTLKNLLALN